MTYLIASAVTSGEVDSDQLVEEIRASGLVPDLTGVSISKGILEIFGTATDQAALDALVAAHDPLPSHKAAKKAAIDAKTREIIARGFTFDGHLFSLSSQAQMNWIGLLVCQSFMTWPVCVTTKDDLEYALAQANLQAFTEAGVAVVAAAYGSGRALKITVDACSTRAAVDAVSDDRA